MLLIYCFIVCNHRRVDGIDLRVTEKARRHIYLQIHFYIYTLYILYTYQPSTRTPAIFCLITHTMLSERPIYLHNSLRGSAPIAAPHYVPCVSEQHYVSGVRTSCSGCLSIWVRLVPRLPLHQNVITIKIYKKYTKYTKCELWKLDI